LGGEQYSEGGGEAIGIGKEAAVLVQRRRHRRMPFDMRSSTAIESW